MRIRLAQKEDLSSILRLYHFLQPSDPVLSPNDPVVLGNWEEILSNKNYCYFLAEKEEKIVSSCTLTLIQNLTRSMKSYAVIENVITDPEFRKQGIGSKLLKSAIEHAWRSNCYKVMLMTGSKREETIRFYEQAGFAKGIKTGFIAYPNEN